MASRLSEIVATIQGLDPQAEGQHSSRHQYIQTLNSKVAGLDSDRVQEGKKEIERSYLEATRPRALARISQEKNPDDWAQFRRIELWGRVSLLDFNSPSFRWDPYFSDFGRAIAAGEQNYLQETLEHEIAADASISRSVPDFQVLERTVEELQQKGAPPDTVLAPIEVYVPFIKHFRQRMEWKVDPEQLSIGKAVLNVFWSHKYAPSSSFMIFSAKAGTWRVVPDPETGSAITSVIGQSSLFSDSVEIGAETTVKYEITDLEAFRVISLSD